MNKYEELTNKMNKEHTKTEREKPGVIKKILWGLAFLIVFFGFPIAGMVNLFGINDNEILTPLFCVIALFVAPFILFPPLIRGIKK